MQLTSPPLWDRSNVNLRCVQPELSSKIEFVTRHLIAAAVLLPALVSCQSAARGHSKFDATAKTDLAAIRAGTCSPVATRFDALMATRLNAAGLCSGFQTYTEAFGGLRRQDAPYSTKVGALTVVRILLHLEHSNGEFRETFHPDGSIAGVYFLKPGVPL